MPMDRVKSSLKNFKSYFRRQLSVYVLVSLVGLFVVYDLVLRLIGRPPVLYLPI